MKIYQNINVKIKCAWCDEAIFMDISETIQKRIETKSDYFQEKSIVCHHCGRKNETSFVVGGGGLPIYRTWVFRALQNERNKKVTTDIVHQFVCSNSIYKTYGLIHPYSVYDFCEINNFDEDEVFEIIENMEVDIFTSLDMNELDEVKYVDEFSKLKLKEDAMTSAGGASLSGLMGQIKAWKDLRNIVLKEKDFICEICGYHADAEHEKQLHVHEDWEQEGEKITLKKVSLICSRCHACKHVNQFVAYRVMNGGSSLVEGIPGIDLITIHLMKVNNVKKEVIYAYRKLLRQGWRELEEKKIDNFIKGL